MKDNDHKNTGQGACPRNKDMDTAADLCAAACPTGMAVECLAGGPNIKKTPVRIFDDTVIAFLDALSKLLRTDPDARRYPDIQSFAFYCRKAGLMRIRGQYPKDEARMGRGLAFHIAPSNVPVNFAFTYVFGLLSGNANIVRVSDHPYAQTDIMIKAVSRLFQKQEFCQIKNRTLFVRFGHDASITDFFSQLADVRVIWGGDQTIRQIQKSPASVRCTDVVFADRFSFGVIRAESVLQAQEADLRRLAGQFYIDTYLFDQNACSTPHVICWLAHTQEVREPAKKRFWDAVAACAQKYDLSDQKVSDKYVMLCKYAMELPDMKVKRYGNRLYVVSVPELKTRMSNLRGKFGLFFQTDIRTLSDLDVHMGKEVQTCLYYGMDRDQILRWVFDSGLAGIDRIAEFGSALSLGIVWDGYDLLREMSRRIGS